MWAFGVLFYFMLNMEYPFSNLCLLFRVESSPSIRIKEIRAYEAKQKLFFCIIGEKNKKETNVKLYRLD